MWAEDGSWVESDDASEGWGKVFRFSNPRPSVGQKRSNTMKKINNVANAQSSKVSEPVHHKVVDIASKPVEKKATKKGNAHKPDPKRVAAAKLAWSRGPKLLKIAAKAEAKRKKAEQAAKDKKHNKAESKKVIAALPKTIKAVEKKMAAPVKKAA